MRCRTRSAGGDAGGGPLAIHGILGLAAVLSMGAVAVPPGLLAQANEEMVTVATGREPLRVPVSRHRGFQAVSLQALAGTLLADITVDAWSASGRLGDRMLHFRAGSPFFRFGEDVYQLGDEAYIQDGIFWVPAELLTRWWPKQLGRLQGATGAEEAGEAWSAPAREPGPWRVVIDPGHGGKDPGTAGRARTREKDVVLGIARRLAAKLAQMPDVRPILTRDRDVFVTVRGRPELALARKGDLFISLHANSAPSRAARGFETYYLGEARSDESRQVAMRENAALQYEDNGETPTADLPFILASLDLKAYRDESNRLGGQIQNALRRVHPGPDRGVKPGPYWVLVRASGSMPTVLVEVGFLSHPEEERFLRDPAAQDRIAEALAGAIRSYLNDLGHQLRSAGAPE